jgi:two-component system, chemotaxis family, protein-glutamate methylesterase/glutaminase
VARDAAGTDVSRVLICDDSRTFAAALKRFLEYDRDLRVEAVVGSAEEALRALPRVRPDLVTMDIELPGINGVDATKRIVAEHSVPILVISSFTERGSQLAAAALGAGASDALAKDDLRLHAHAGPAADALRRRIKRLAGIDARGRHSNGRTPRYPASETAARLRRQRASVIAIGASVGGPHALLEVLSRLPADYSVPLMVVQHMSPGFTAGLTSWLDRQVPLPVGLAQHGLALGPGVWFAPEDVHLVVDRSMRMSLDGTLAAGPHRPAADVLLRSVADAAGGAGVGVILTGMGRDGARGIAALRSAGGLTIAQDPSTSVVWGMPQAAVDSGAELVLPLPEIGAALCRLGNRAHVR